MTGRELDRLPARALKFVKGCPYTVEVDDATTVGHDVEGVATLVVKSRDPAHEDVFDRLRVSLDSSDADLSVALRPVLVALGLPFKF